MFEMIAYALLLPVAALMDWHYWLRRAQTQGTPRENEIALASHGAGFLALCGLAVDRVGPTAFGEFLRNAVQGFPAEWMYWIPALIFAGFVRIGAVWFLSGANRSLTYAGFRDSRLLSRAIIKLGFGVFLVIAFWYPPAGWPPYFAAWLILLRLFEYTGPVVVGLVVWLLVTGSVRLVLVLWQRRSRARELVAADIAANKFDWNRRR